jgi:RNA polymerase sigma-70 factor (ECF subfamily)
MARASKQEQHTEHLLIEQARGGSPEAFCTLVKMHSPQIYHISLRILRNPADAEDNVQNVIWKMYANIRQFEGRSRLSSWLVRITINEALMTIRARPAEYLILDALTPESEDAIVTDIVCDPYPDPERQYMAKELMAKAFWGLPPSCVDLFIRNKMEGYTQRALAREIGTTLSAIKSRIFHARERMRHRVQAIS